jgi:hypothetical protein
MDDSAVAILQPPINRNQLHALSSRRLSFVSVSFTSNRNLTGDLSGQNPLATSQKTCCRSVNGTHSPDPPFVVRVLQ